MDPNTKLTSIEFTSAGKHDALLASVRLNYSNEETKLFENINPSSGEPWKTFNFGEIMFDEANESISAVKAISHGNGVDSIRFLNEADVVISQWNPKNYGHGRKIDIAENEEIVGVYGHQNTGKTFRNFGFIVKVK